MSARASNPVPLLHPPPDRESEPLSQTPDDPEKGRGN